MKRSKPTIYTLKVLGIKSVTAVLIVILFNCTYLLANDTIYFRLSSPWNSVKSPTGDYLRKCFPENEYFHVWDYGKQNNLVTESFYADTNFTFKLLCHKYFNETKGYLEQTRCYENGRLNGYWVDYNEKGDTVSWQLMENNTVVKSWSAKDNNGRPAFVLMEEPAAFFGGSAAWQDFLQQHLKYPKALKKENISGYVSVKMTINKFGVIDKVEVLESPHPLLSEEVIRVIKKSPRWKPAVQNGKAVPMTITQRVSF